MNLNKTLSTYLYYYTSKLRRSDRGENKEYKEVKGSDSNASESKEQIFLFDPLK